MADHDQAMLDEENLRTSQRASEQAARLAERLAGELGNSQEQSADGKATVDTNDLDALRAQLLDGKDNGKQSGKGLNEVLGERGEDPKDFLDEAKSTGVTAMLDSINAMVEKIKDIPADIADSVKGFVHGAKADFTERPEWRGGIGKPDEDGKYAAENKAEGKLESAKTDQVNITKDLVNSIDTYQESMEGLKDPEKVFAAIEESKGISLDEKSKEAMITAMEKSATRAAKSIETLQVDLEKAEVKTDKAEDRLALVETRAEVVRERLSEVDKADSNREARVEKREAIGNGQDMTAELAKNKEQEVAGITGGEDAISAAKEARSEARGNVSKTGDALEAVGDVAKMVTGVAAVQAVSNAMSGSQLDDGIKEMAENARASLSADDLKNAVPTELDVKGASVEAAPELAGEALERKEEVAANLAAVLNEAELPKVTQQDVAAELQAEGLNATTIQVDQPEPVSLDAIIADAQKVEVPEQDVQPLEVAAESRPLNEAELSTAAEGIKELSGQQPAVDTNEVQGLVGAEAQPNVEIEVAPEVAQASVEPVDVDNQSLAAQEAASQTVQVNEEISNSVEQMLDKQENIDAVRDGNTDLAVGLEEVKIALEGVTVEPTEQVAAAVPEVNEIDLTGKTVAPAAADSPQAEEALRAEVANLAGAINTGHPAEDMSEGAGDLNAGQTRSEENVALLAEVGQGRE